MGRLTAYVVEFAPNKGQFQHRVASLVEYMCPKRVHEGRYDDPCMSLSVVLIDLGNLRGQMFSRTGFAPSGALHALMAEHIARCSGWTWLGPQRVFYS
jgi:hypothetical protein